MKIRTIGEACCLSGLSILALLMAQYYAPVCEAADPIPQNRRINWQPGVVGGIPNRTTIFKALTATNTLADINNAINACPSNQVVFLSAGTYSLGGNILFNQKSGVTLRGAGPGQTILRFYNWSSANLLIEGQPFEDPNTTPPANLVNWTGGYVQGTTNIAVSSAAGLVVGTMLILDQLNDNVDVNGAGSEGCSYCGRLGGGRAQMQAVRVTGISGTHLAIWPGLYMPNWSPTNSPGAWWIGGAVEMSGVEDLSIDNLASGGSINVGFQNARNCWAKNLKSSSTASLSHYHVKTYIAADIEVRHSMFQGVVNSPGNDHYGVDWFWSWDCLAEDNVFSGVTLPLVLEAGAEGNVNAYNYCTNMLYYDSTWLVAGFSGHAAHAAFNLFEGNYGNALYLDFIHGSGSHTTALRNRITGWEAGKGNNTYCIAAQYMNRYDNIVGNVLGTDGYHDRYECANGGCNNPKTIYYLGYYDTLGSYPKNYDMVVPNSIIRSGNYDYVSRAMVASAGLPISYYLPSKPSWFGDRPWPPFDPARPSMATVTNLPAGYRCVFGIDPPPATLFNRPPVAVVSATPQSGDPPLRVTFSSGGAYDPEGVALTYYWAFGDGSTSTEANPTHNYQAAGAYTAKLSVSDGVLTTSRSWTVRVGDSGNNLITK